MLLRVCEMMLKAERLTLCKRWGGWWEVLSTEDLELHSTVHWLEAEGQLKLSMTHLQKHTGRHKTIHNRVRCYVACVCVCVLWQTTCCDWFTDLYSTPKTISDPVTTYTAIINEKTSSRPDSTDFHSGAQFCQTPHYWKDFLFKKAISPVKCFISVTCTHKQNTLNHPFPNVQKSWQNQQIVPYLLPVCVYGSIQ